jgi:hypothetical protein
MTRQLLALTCCSVAATLSLLLYIPSSCAQDSDLLSSTSYNFWGVYEQEGGEWVVSLFSQGISLYNSFGSVRFLDRAQAAKCIDRLSKQAKSMDAIEVFRDNRVRSSISTTELHFFLTRCSGVRRPIPVSMALEAQSLQRDRRAAC